MSNLDFILGTTMTVLSIIIYNSFLSFYKEVKDVGKYKK